MSQARKLRRAALQRQRRMVIKLNADGAELPTEFRLFVKGWNDTENGRFLFDAKAAQSVMAAYEKWGVDLAIDLEHQMLEVEPGASPDPSARDARGSCKLELRPDGSLWACDVHWTPDGARRLKEKTQRYVSPAFEVDPKTSRVTKLINVAITAMPATHKTPALVAASATNGSKRMDPSLVKQALEAIAKGDAKAALEILTGLVASAAGADPDADGDADGGEGDGAEGVAPPAETEAVEDPKVVDNAAPPPPAKDGDKGDDEDEDDDKPAAKAARKVLRAALRRMTGKPTFAEAVAEVEIYRASHIMLATETAKLAKERQLLEGAERRKLVGELVKLGAEFPSTVWADDKATAVKPRWAKMPIAELRTHVAEQRAARRKPEAPTGPGVKPAAPEAQHVVGNVVVELTAAEKKICKEQGCDETVYAQLKARRDGKVS